MGNEENKAPMAEKIDLTPVEVDPSLSDEAEFGKPDNDSKSYGMFLKAFSIIAALLAHDRVGTDVYDQAGEPQKTAHKPAAVL